MVAGKLADANDQNMGFNAQTDVYENLVTAGVIDPTKVVRAALQDAASIAGLIITTEAAIVELPDDKPAMPMGGRAEWAEWAEWISRNPARSDDGLPVWSQVVARNSERELAPSNLPPKRSADTG